MGVFYEAIADELTPYVRAMAWWHAVPLPRPSKNPQPELPGSRKSRMTIRIEAGGVPDLPPIPAAFTFLLEYLFDAGPTSPSGTGSVALTWADLDAWQRGSGVSLPAWISRLLRRLSSEYLAQSVKAVAHDAPPPWDREPERVRVARHVRQILRG